VNRGWCLAIGLAAIAAAAAPLYPRTIERSATAANWPSDYDGRPIRRLPAAPEDALLTRNFPGSVARFSDGRRQIVLRRVSAATRQLHPARDCFRALGYVIAPAPMRIAPGGQSSSCFDAVGKGRTLRVCEQVRDAKGRSFPDVSSWYWPALLGSSQGPWLAALTVERSD
jgi:hypothetical protein